MTQQSEQRVYAAIDLKSFYASVECRERGMDPMTTNLVVADESRTEKTICLAVSPSLKAHGISGRARLFEVVQRVKEVNRERLMRAPGRRFTGKSWNDRELRENPSLELAYIAAVPRMAYYMEYSTRILNVYLKYVSMDDIHVYSIDEVMIDLTSYLPVYGLTARELTAKLIREVFRTTGITATAGIGPNLYLAKIAMDIMAKRQRPDPDGVRIAELDEMSYRRELWTHRPLTDFWRVGRGYRDRLEAAGIFTMGDVARCSVRNEELLYRLFGVNAELLIDHAWGWEPCTIREIKAYRPENSSMNSGQVLMQPYPFDKARIVLREMAEGLAFSLMEKGLKARQVALTVGYDREGTEAAEQSGETEIQADRYGRRVPKPAHGSENLKEPTSSADQIIGAALSIYDRVVNPKIPVRRLYVTAGQLISREEAEKERAAGRYEQLDLFTDLEETLKQEAAEKAAREKEEKLQEAMLSIRQRYGKNAVVRGTSLQEGATGRDRNRQIGGHRA